MDATTVQHELTKKLGFPIGNASEETFVLFSQKFPSNNLGMVAPYDSEISVQVRARDITLRQSVGLLNSNRALGTTGAALWKISHLLANWLTDTGSLPWTAGILHPQANVVELGCGMSGLVGIALSSLVSSYLLTDQGYVMKGLKHNLAVNVTGIKSSSERHTSDRAHAATHQTIRTMTLDWEHDRPGRLEDMLGVGRPLDLIVACDCVYNDFLLPSFVAICTELCKSGSSTRGSPVLLVAQQLRSDGVFESWLERTMQDFHVWRIANEYLPEYLQSNSGYVVHLSVLNADRRLG